MSLTVGRRLRFRLPVRPDSARSFSNRLKVNHCQPCVWTNDDPHRSSAQVGNGRIQRAIDKSVIPDWLSFRCGEDGADDDWSCGAACGNLLRIARSRTGMSQREFAEAAGLPQSTIARMESGARQPSLPVLARILAAVDLELRITVKDYDSHDDVLDANDARLTDDARLGCPVVSWRRTSSCDARSAARCPPQ